MREIGYFRKGIPKQDANQIVRTPQKRSARLPRAGSPFDQVKALAILWVLLGVHKQPLAAWGFSAFYL